MAYLDSVTKQKLEDAANRMRINSIKSTSMSNSGHPTSCLSAAEVMSVLFFHTMRHSVRDPRSPHNDRFVLSKGHAAPVLYAAWAEAGLLQDEELLNLRKIHSDLEGHPTPRLSFVDIATGSLGQGLGCAAGMAYTGKYFDKTDYRVYCLVGDGESTEGSVWEALFFASHYKLDNLVCVIDVNRLGQSEATAFQHDMESYKRKLDAFGWHTFTVDGHNVDILAKVLDEAKCIKDKPTCVLAKTIKGKGITAIEDALNWHGKPIGIHAESAIAEIGARIQYKEKLRLIEPPESTRAPKVDITHIKMSSRPDYKLGDHVTTRAAYGKALAKLGDNNDRVVALDGDTKDSTYTQTFRDAHPDRFIECFIAEQNLVAVAIGCTTRDRTVAFASTFATFFSRAYDHIRMGAISQSNVNYVGSHCGLSIGEDGPIEMGLEDLAMFRAIPGATVFYPSDAVSCEYAVELAANTKGMCFIRTTRPPMPVIYKSEEAFQVGQAKVVRESSRDQVTVLGCGVTLHEALKAADTLAKSGINIRVIDPFTLKPFDSSLVIQSAQQTGGKIITVEDHYPEGGLGEAVSAALSEIPGISITRLAVKEIPRSGKPEELMEMFGISANCIVHAVKGVLHGQN